MDAKHRTMGNIMLVLCSLVWGFAFAFQRSAADDMNAVAFNGLRFALAAAVILIFLIVSALICKKKGIRQIGFNKDTLIGGILCGISLLIACNLQQYSMQFISAGKAGFITSLYIVWVPIIGLFLRKKVDVLSRFAVPLALVGFYLMCYDGELVFGKGELMGLACTVLFAIQIQFIDAFGKDADPVKLTFVQFVTCAVLSIPFMLVFGFPTQADVKASIVPLVYVGIFSAGIGYTLQTAGQKYTEPNAASIIMSMESVIGFLGGILILKEQHGLLEMLGGIFVLAAAVMSQLIFEKRFLQFDKKRFDLVRNNIKSRVQA